MLCTEEFTSHYFRGDPACRLAPADVATQTPQLCTSTVRVDAPYHTRMRPYYHTLLARLLANLFGALHPCHSCATRLHVSCWNVHCLHIVVEAPAVFGCDILRCGPSPHQCSVWRGLVSPAGSRDARGDSLIRYSSGVMSNILLHDMTTGVHTPHTGHRL